VRCPTRPRRRSRPHVLKPPLYLRPPALGPAGHGLLVSFLGPPCRALQAPAHRPKQLPHVPRVVADPGKALDHLSHAGTRPKLRSVALGKRAFEQRPLDLAKLRRGKKCRASRAIGGLKRPYPPFAPSLMPAVSRLRGDLQAPGDLSLGNPLVKQLSRLAAPSFEPLQIPAGAARPGPPRTHRCSC
jgi:hypothetical protein